MRARVCGYVVSGIASVLSACSGSEGPMGTVPSADLAVYGTCGLEPNYVAATTFEGRFFEFPIDVYIDLSGAPADLRPRYRAALEQGFGAWSAASHGEIGSVTFVTGPLLAHIRVEFVPLIPGEDFALAASRVTRLQSGSPDLILEAVIEFSANNMASRFGDRLRQGLITPTTFTDRVAAIAAHEMGHSMGIESHPGGGTEWLMSSNGFDFRTGPMTADLNTLRDNYCRP